MSKILTLLSGKGGSGKTTIALSIAAMLANCGMKVLLVDCDLATNGGSYFFEDLLSNESHKAVSLYDIISGKASTNYHFIRTNNAFDFFPSIAKITKDAIRATPSEESKTNWERFEQAIQNKYEVIIYPELFTII